MIKKGYDFEWIKYQGAQWHIVFVIKSLDDFLQGSDSGTFECVMWMRDPGPRYFKSINVEPLGQYVKHKPTEEEMREVVRLYFEGNSK